MFGDDRHSESGEASGVPIIKSLLNACENDSRNIIIDCPPGSACTVMESIRMRTTAFCGRATVFGVHNLTMVYEPLNSSANLMGLY